MVWGERLDFKISPLLLHYSCLSEKISENGKVYNALALCSPGGVEFHFGHMTMIAQPPYWLPVCWHGQLWGVNMASRKGASLTLSFEIFDIICSSKLLNFSTGEGREFGLHHIPSSLPLQLPLWEDKWKFKSIQCPLFYGLNSIFCAWQWQLIGCLCYCHQLFDIITVLSLGK